MPATFSRIRAFATANALLRCIPDPGAADARKNSATEFLNAVLSPRKE